MNKFLILFIIAGLITPVFFASAITGTIDGTIKWAWSDQIGWINFGCTPGCNVQVDDDDIIGYAWSPNYGWISLSCLNNGSPCSTSWGIKNANGTLSGYAWGENVGWIDFAGVFINTSGPDIGKFHGAATGPVVGNIQFDLATPQPGTPVTTTWTPGGAGVCGDNVIQFPEECDGVDLGLANCVTKGYDSGTLGCHLNCTFDTSSCIGSGGSSHNECSARRCISVATPGTSQCLIDTDCQCDTHGDINKDGKIDIVDFSILLYFWHDVNISNPCADINQDGKVELTDFSIMLYWWTG